MKKRYGNVAPDLEVDQEEQVGIENGHSASYRDLCDIIRSRIEELLQLTLLEMPTSDYRSLAPCGLVLTGGTANLAGFEELGRSVLQMPVRKGRPLNSGIYGISDILHDSAYATTLGLILWPINGKEGAAFRVKRAGILSGFASLVRRLLRS
jgi:cell division protein FtsA